MTTFLKVLATILFVLAAALATAYAQAAVIPDGITEIQKLKVENLQLKIQVAQLQATVADRDAKLASVTLSSERTMLETDLLKTLKAEPGDTIDWSTLTLKKATPKK